MTYLVLPPEPPASGPRTETHAAHEARLIAARLASARKWARRRRWLRLRVLVFGRRKARRLTEREGGRGWRARAVT